MLTTITETYYLGLEKEAKKYASILGYNYNSGKWFEESYKLLNNNTHPNFYKIDLIEEKRETLLQPLQTPLKHLAMFLSK